MDSYIDTFLETHNKHIFDSYDSYDSYDWLCDTTPKYTMNNKNNNERKYILNSD